MPAIILASSVVDPDLYVFGPPGSGSVSQRYRFCSGSSKNIKKNLFCDFFMRKVISKYKKYPLLLFVAILKVTDENRGGGGGFLTTTFRGGAPPNRVNCSTSFR